MSTFQQLAKEEYQFFLGFGVLEGL